MLTDLIEGQGNMAVAVDLEEGIVERERNLLFIAVAGRARSHGERSLLKDPPADFQGAVRSSKAGDMVETLPRGAWHG